MPILTRCLLTLSIQSVISIERIKNATMFSIVFYVLLLLSVKAQFYYQQQYPYNNYNSWLPYSQNYPAWNQIFQQCKPSFDSVYNIRTKKHVYLSFYFFLFILLRPNNRSW